MKEVNVPAALAVLGVAAKEMVIQVEFGQNKDKSCLPELLGDELGHEVAHQHLLALIKLQISLLGKILGEFARSL